MRKTGHIPAKADTEKQASFLGKELNRLIEKAKNGKIALLFSDSAHFVMETFLCCLGSIKRLFIPSPAGRQLLNVIGAIDSISKKVIFGFNTTYVNTLVLIDFLTYLRTQIKDIPIVLVLDNARYRWRTVNTVKLSLKWHRVLELLYCFYPHILQT